MAVKLKQIVKNYGYFVIFFILLPNIFQFCDISSNFST